MSKGAQVALAAVVGGTAEALGGGKPARLCRNNALANARIIRRGGVANGAVTGAYVMMLNHLAHQGDGGDEKNHEVHASNGEIRMKSLAINLRYNPYALGYGNPFLGAEAIYIDAGGVFVGAEYDKGYFFILAGDDYGQLIPYTEDGGGGSPEVSIGVELGRVDLSDKSIPFQTEMLFGERNRFWGGAAIVGGAVSHSTYRGVHLISTSVNIGLSVNPFGAFSAGWNKGKIEPRR